MNLRVAILDADSQRRNAAAGVLSQISDLAITQAPIFPQNVDDFAKIIQSPYDVVLINADCDQQLTLDLAANLADSTRTELMVYSSRPDMQLVVQLMHAGVREILTAPLDSAELTAAMERAAERYASNHRESRKNGRLFVFMGSKGGCGVTTIAANFALALTEESKGKTLLIDLGLPLGDAATNLGIKTEFSVFNALQRADRLDTRMLSTMVAKHDTGLEVLASPLVFFDEPAPMGSVDRLIAVAREAYDFVVADVGTRLDLFGSSLFDKSAVVYLVAQVGITELLNANRMVNKFFLTRNDSLQIVLNRFRPGDSLFDERKVKEALTRPAQWKIPDDYAAARRTRDTATPMVLIDSPIARAIREMAKAAVGGATEKAGKKGLFGFLR
ncbi:MAG: AAA family ATPase [Terracidiphilus sp.]